MTASKAAKRIEVRARGVGGKPLANRIEVRHHQLLADEPEALGGNDEGPTPQELLAASLASCTAITLQLYARRKGWELDPITVDCEYVQCDPGGETTFKLVLHLPEACSEEQIKRLGAIAAKCPVHRTLESTVAFEQRIELS